jgi:predicted double-glycine peptidase
MKPWLDTIGVLLLAVLGFALGLIAGKIKNRIWLFFYAIPLILIISVALTRNFSYLQFYQPFTWLTAGRREFVIFAFTVPVMFSILIPRLAIRRQKIMLVCLVVVASWLFFVAPFVSPILARHELLSLDTTLTSDGICLQTTRYTCGPAAAVTALGQLGIEAKESELAILAYTSPQMGTVEDLLADAIEKKYADRNVKCTIRFFNSAEELQQNCPVIATVKHSFFVDHFVTVLEVKDGTVIIGDPLAGRVELSYEDFEKKWRYVGIVLKKR